MADSNFRCVLVEKDDAGEVQASHCEKSIEELPQGDVLIRVHYSSLNYKDGLAATGHPGVAKSLPHVPGIDAVGVVARSSSDSFSEGDEVIVTGYELGAGRWGGWSEYIRVPADWIVPMPAGVSMKETMIFGTAGFTAGLSVAGLIHHGIRPDSGKIVVTGSTGGVGILSVMILAKLGYEVVAVTGKEDKHDWLKNLGASEVLPRDAVCDDSSRPLLKSQWSGAVDTVGGNTLGTLLRSVNIDGCVTACGLVGGLEIPTTVHPFILRGVSLVGIASAWTPMEKRLEVWKKLLGDWKPANLEEIVRETSLGDVLGDVPEILAGRVFGRIVVRVVS